MKLKTFFATDMTEALALVREQLGDDAIIVNSQSGEAGRGVYVTAAIDDVEPDFDGDYDLAGAIGGRPQAGRDHRGDDGAVRRAGAIDHMTRALDYHGIPRELANRLIDAAGSADLEAEISGAGEDATAVLRHALGHHFDFRPVPLHGFGQPIALIGPPGVGKTVATAKLAARAILEGQAIRVITTDAVRAGGVEQLAAYADLLKVDLIVAGSARELVRAVDWNRGPVVIDTAGINPFFHDEIDDMRVMLQAAEVEPVLVAAAGGDPLEALDIGRAFRPLKPRRLIATRLDGARRFGGLLATAAGAGAAFADASITAHVDRGFSPLAAGGLARLLMRDPLKIDFEQSPDREALP